MLYKKWRKLEEFYTWIDLFIINLFCKSEVERLIRIIATILTWDSKSVLEISQTSTQFFNVKSSSRVVIDKEDFLRCKTVEVESHFCHSLKLGVEMPKCIWEVKHCFVLTDSSWLRKISIFACSRYFFWYQNDLSWCQVQDVPWTLISFGIIYFHQGMVDW